MRITIVSGFFLPIPPAAGGATEKSWYELARRFVAEGHTVTIISRRWPGWADDETAGGIRHLRLPGFNHRRRLAANLLLDFLWSWRVFFALPRADVVVVNAVTLPAWLGWGKPAAGRVVLMTGRMPKGQYRFYRRIALVLAASSYVRDRVTAENPALAAVTRIYGYPLDWAALQQPARPANPAPPAIGYVGRLHEEKGLRLLAGALEIVARTPGLPAWRLVVCGPADVARGGSGTEFKAMLEQRLAAALPSGAVSFLEPRFDPRALAEVYRSLDVFCYPSLAEEGETFGLAVAEAMAAGAVPVVSRLACFTDFVSDGADGLVFDHRAADPAAALAACLVRLLRDPALRQRLAAAAVTTARRYDHAAYAAAALADFRQLTGPAKPASSAP
jgi:glycosyltransferase involved in cell wall biosynthesis